MNKELTENFRNIERKVDVIISQVENYIKKPMENNIGETSLGELYLAGFSYLLNKSINYASIVYIFGNKT